jgi:uncharacterized membrane protein YfhO
VETREANVLTLANPMFPGWTAWIDGRPVLLSTAAGEAIAVGVPEGRHGVELVYAPWSFRIGCVTAFAAALTLALLARRSSPRRKASPAVSA